MTVFDNKFGFREYSGLDFPKRRTVEILGSVVPVLVMSEAVERTAALIEKRDGRCRHIVNTGFHGIWEGHKAPAFRRMLATADFWVPDGIAFPLIARLKGHRAKRLAGPEFVEAFLALANERGYRSFFFGDTEGTLAALESVLMKKYPKHKIVGTLSPPFRPLTQEEDDAYVQAINDAAPDVLWVGLGCPKQETWIFEHRDRLNVPVAVGIGAIFRFLGGTVERAPQWIGNLGLEWLWRLAKEPRKCWRRCVLDGPRFIASVSMELAAQRRSCKKEVVG